MVFALLGKQRKPRPWLVLGSELSFDIGVAVALDPVWEKREDDSEPARAFIRYQSKVKPPLGRCQPASPLIGPLLNFATDTTATVTMSDKGNLPAKLVPCLKCSSLPFSNWLASPHSTLPDAAPISPWCTGPTMASRTGP